MTCSKSVQLNDWTQFLWIQNYHSYSYSSSALYLYSMTHLRQTTGNEAPSSTLLYLEVLPRES